MNEKIRNEIKNKEKNADLLLSAIMLIGSIGFLIVGISSYTKYNLIDFLNAKEILFFPQGLTMSFYGVLGSIISVYQIVITNSNVGEGYNEFDKQKGTLTIFRKKFPWQKDDITLTYPINDIEAIKIEKNNTILNTKQIILICIKGKKEIPIIQTRTPIKVNELEKEASEIASFLKVPIKGI